jgi:dTDP-4-amino-4,6-dideoxygalactose transaminase
MFKQIIATNPVLDWDNLTFGSSHSPPYPLLTNNIKFYGYARYGLYDALKTMKLREGDSLLLPQKICNVVLAPINALRLKVKYYRTDEKWQIDLNHTEDILDNRTRAILAVNYFGFPQPFGEIKSFCRRHNLYFIEDNSQGFLSSLNGKQLGSFGDVALFSFRKTVPIPNGAAVVVNHPQLWEEFAKTKQSSNLWRRNGRYILRTFARIIEQKTHIPCISSLVSLMQKRKSIETLEALEYNLKDFSEPISIVSQHLLKYFDYPKLVHLRRKAFSFWQEYFACNENMEAQPLFDTLPDDAVPYAFPVKVEKKPDEILQMFLKDGIECSFWALYPKEVQKLGLNRILLIPVHYLPKKFAFNTTEDKQRWC